MEQQIRLTKSSYAMESVGYLHARSNRHMDGQPNLGGDDIFAACDRPLSVLCTTRSSAEWPQQVLLRDIGTSSECEIKNGLNT
jgi:hypothetical protein